ncbi:translocation/assembly module TamB domain-containing protein [Sphingomonas nostoxanthinifaciens]|uniref:translocation/assembly module TamB domain-containing protein n=1 Tax=Sphingomonas nostoxanthinifaciens TaxID=2872652 RepID=UPI001CC1EF05|nr:translocation/assembly module TamB domain-containing protein [Sphingomonas nostoxanthinifaciens]UAK23966.1 translocation/assembly module TamB domain-containing protein [Sphingomonas nostoxanthinifaciens]
MALRIAKWIGIALAALVLLVVVVVLGLNTSAGKRFLVDRLAGFQTASGISVHTSRIEGSIYGRMVLRDLDVRDAQGSFLTSPALTVDWRPFAYLHSKIDVRELSAGLVTFIRKPVLKPTPPSPPGTPTLPDIDLTLGRMKIDRFVLEAPVTGQRHIVSMVGSATIANGRAQINTDAAAIRAIGVAGGDRLHLMLDAVPDANRFALDAHVSAPKGGVLDSYAKLGRPIDLTVGGKGDWAHWQGKATGLLGTDRLADLTVDGANGDFHTTGSVRPGLILTGPAARLTEPAITIDLRTKLANRSIDTTLAAHSDALAVKAAGLIDLANSRLGNFHVDAALLTPGVIAPNVRGRDVKLSATLDGPFATPTVDYKVSAAAIGFGATGVSRLDVEGKAKIDANRITVPVHATAGAVTGVNAAAGSLLTHLRLDGDIAYENGKVATDNLRVRSDRVDATAIILADLAKGKYTGALKGRVNDYEVNGLGRIDLTTDAKLVPGINNGFAIAGKVKIVTRRFDNASVRDQLGGNALITADVGYDLAGGATLRNLRLTAPKLRITGGAGGYRPDGRIRFHAVGQSAAYGPFTLDAGGTIAKPVARLVAARPGLGASVTGLEATLQGTAAGYRVQARGQSAYGPFAADVTIRTGKGPMAFDIAQATFAGIRFGGSVVQTAAGPFAGLLTLNGSGLNGTVRLAAVGKAQQAIVDVRAQAAKLPGPMLVTIGSGRIQATALLPSGGTPSVTGSFALSDVRYGTTALARAQGKIDYRNGAGSVQLVANGQAGAPFDVAAQATLSPTRVIANLRGTVNGIAIRLAQPAIVTKAGAAWTLQPATIVLPQGQIDLSGSYGTAPRLHAVIRNLDLSISEAFMPALGLGGAASGTVDYVGGGTVPDVRARIDVNGFSRTAALTVSDPVDIALLATLNQNGGDARAIIRRQGATVGRLQARLAPLGAGASLTERLMGAPLSGGIRYNGPAEVLWTLTGIAKQQLSGPIAIGADFGGRVSQPTVTGIIRASTLRYENGTYGTLLTNIAIDGRFTQAQFQLNSLTARAGKGTLSASGNVGIAAASGFPIDVTAKLDNAQLAHGDDIDATVSGSLHVTNSKANGGLVQGDLTIPEARYAIVKQGAAAVPVLTGVRRKGVQPPAAGEADALPSNWKLDIRLRADNRIFVSGMGLEAEWRTDMHVTGTSTAPQITGKLEVVRGTFSFASRRFDLDHGVITFQGAQFTNPALDIAASTTVEGVTATINIGGYAQAPQISFTSTPTLPQDEVLSRLLFGSSVTSLSPTQAIQLAAALNSLRGSGGGGLNPLGKLRSVAGIDRLRVLGADKSTGQGTSLAAGKYISNNVYVEIVTDARGFTATQLEISLSKALSVLSQTGSFGGSNVALRYKKDY